MGFWYVHTTTTDSATTVEFGTGDVQECVRSLNREFPAGFPSEVVSELVAECKCLIAAAAFAVIAFLFALLAAFAACIAGIRRFGAVLSGIGALFALVSLVIYVAKFHDEFAAAFSFPGGSHRSNISAGWPCEIAAFLFLVIQAMVFMRVPKPGSEQTLFTSQLQPQLIYGQGPYGAPQQQYAPQPAYPPAGRQYGQPQQPLRCEYDGRCYRLNPDHWIHVVHLNQDGPVDRPNRGQSRTEPP